jgi:hypothetical protein
VRDGTLLIARACELGRKSIKNTKTETVRTVRLLATLAADLAEGRTRCGRPDDGAAVCPKADPWTKADWDNWRDRRWHPALALGTSGHLIDEHQPRVDLVADDEIRVARGQGLTASGPRVAPARVSPFN